MKVSRDKYELPEAVAESANELARILGITENAIYCRMSQAKKFGYRSRFVKVVIDEEDDDE
jgi:hypothetical protein